MRVFVVDNYSIFSKNVYNHLAGHDVSSAYIDGFSASMAKDADAVILTGSRRYSALENSEEYGEQEKVIRSGKPVFGICAGHQLICRIHGAKFHNNDPIVKGVHPLSIEAEDLVLEGIRELTVYKSHRWSALQAPNLSVIARSPAGAELVRIPGTLTYGAQYHPEMRDEQNTGYMVLENWLRLVSRAA